MSPDPNAIEKIVKGPIGGIVSALLAAIIVKSLKEKWARRIPVKYEKKNRAQLLSEYSQPIRLAKIFTLFGFGFLFWFAATRRISDHDWRMVGLIIGNLGFFPLFAVLVEKLSRGTSIKEGITAFSISEKTPPEVLFRLLVIMTAIGFVCFVWLIVWP